MLQQVGYLLTTTVLLMRNICQHIFKYPPTNVILMTNIFILFYLVAKLVGGEGEDSKVARELEGNNVNLLQYLEYKLWSKYTLMRIHIGPFGMCMLWVGYTFTDYSY